MKKINKDEFLTGIHKYYKHPVSIAITALEVDEAISIDFDEWNESTILQQFILYYAKKSNKKFSVRMRRHSEVWLVLRIK